jgi:hypothetical protein
MEVGFQIAKRRAEIDAADVAAGYSCKIKSPSAHQILCKCPVQKFKPLSDQRFVGQRTPKTAFY